VMEKNTFTRMSEITDGTSNTILITEDAGRPTRWTLGQKVSGVYSGGAAWSAGINRIILNGWSPLTGSRPGPCALNCTNENEVYSFHLGGANFVFADGSVHFLHQGIDIRILARLVTRAGEEVVTVP
jgi:prepilin-type processing-associated H-X9-DG protein